MHDVMHSIIKTDDVMHSIIKTEPYMGIFDVKSTGFHMSLVACPGMFLNTCEIIYYKRESASLLPHFRFYNLRYVC